MKPTNRNRKRMARNILAVWNNATPIERAEGLEWYDVAHGAASSLAATHGLSVGAVAVVVSILSPSNRWERNIEEADTLISAHVGGRSLDSFSVSTYGQNKRKAWAYLAGSVVEPFGSRAQKTGAFAALIANPTGRAVCVDGHACNIALDDRKPLAQTKVGVVAYRALADAYRMAADSAGVHPHQMQAVTWLVWRANGTEIAV